MFWSVATEVPTRLNMDAISQFRPDMRIAKFKFQTTKATLNAQLRSL